MLWTHGRACIVVGNADKYYKQQCGTGGRGSETMATLLPASGHWPWTPFICPASCI